MSPELIAAIAAGVVSILILGILIFRRVPKKLKANVFTTRWKIVQGYCKDKSQWSLALAEADALLDLALRKRKFKGKSMGERLVSAQRLFANNDGVWFAHNLYKKVIAEPGTRLKEAEMKSALVGFRQALRDLGALDVKSNESRGVSNEQS